MIENAGSLLDKDFLHKLERLSIVNKHVKRGTQSGNRRSRNLGSSIEFADYRSYTPGDDIRQIDWNAYARHEKLFLKTFMDEQEVQISIYIDCSKSMDFGNPTKFQTGIKIAGALGYLSLYNLDKVSLYSFDNQINAVLPSLMGKGKGVQLFNFLNSIATKNEGDINAALTSGKALNKKPGISIILSDFLFANGYEKGINFIQSANQEVVLIQILTKEEKDPYLDGDLRLIDSENSSTKEISISPIVLREYRKTLENYQSKLEEYAQKRGISFISIDSEMNIEDIILNVLKKSGLIR